MKKISPRTELLAGLMQAINTSISNSDVQTTSKEQKQANRRSFLSNAAKLAAGTAMLPILDSCTKASDSLFLENRIELEQSANNRTTLPRIAIIGGGIAGLHAAYTLKNAGFTSTVYEAANRIGGRMFTGRNLMGQGLYTELGGEFIDSIHTDMLNLAKTFGLELLDTKLPNNSTLSSQAYFFNGRHYSEQEVIDAFTPFVPKIKADQQGMSALITADTHSDFDKMLDNMSMAQYFDRIGLNGWLRNLLDVAYVTEFGQPIDQQTALNFLWMISPKVTDGSFEIFGYSDERYKIKGGNDQIITKLAESIKGQVQTAHELTSISQNSDGSQSLNFKTATGNKIVVADYVLITIPFTLLRNVSVSPAWPDWKRKAIFDLGYGNNSKLFIGFKNRYWNKLGYAGYYFTDNMLQSGWDNSELQAPVEGGLTIYSGGQQALNVGNGSTSLQVSQHLPLLEKMYPGANSNLNGKAERFIWPTYKWSKCSYTCFKPGQYTTIAGNEIKPVNNIYFAGEHCSYDYQGYMNGGAETGRRAAEAIIRKVKLG
jgi:monoamine oxidase